MRVLSLALRNLMRNRRRSLATIAAVAVGSTSILLFGGYSANIRYSMETAYVRGGGHLQVQHREFNQYGSGNPTAYGIKGYERLIDAVRSDEVLQKMVVVATPTLQFGGIAGNYAASVSRTVIATGMVPVDQALMRQWNFYDIPLISPPLALNGAKSDAALLGVGVARVLQLCGAFQIDDCQSPQKDDASVGAAIPDDIAQLSALETSGAKKDASSSEKAKLPRVELLASSARGTPNVASLEVVQVEGQGFKELDDVYLAMHLSQAQRLVYGAGPPRATAVMVQLKQPQQLPAARARLEAMLPTWSAGQPLAVLDLHLLNPFFVQTNALFATIFGFIFVLIGGIVLFTVSNTMNTAVVERTIEIGTLRAMGLRRSGIRFLFVTEGALLGFAGALSGVFVALAISVMVNGLGLEWLPPGSAEPLPLVLRVWGETSTIVGTSAVLIAVATLSAWWPAYRAAKLSVVEALRHA